MKKILSISTISILTLFFVMPVLAKGGQPSAAAQQRVQDPATHQEIPVATPRAAQNDIVEEGLPMMKGMGEAAGALNRVVERTNNPEVGEQIRTMVQTHEQVQARTETALQNMEQRKGALKFLLGPNYKNAGEVRSNLVQLRNDVKELEDSKDELSAADVEEVDVAIAELEAQAVEIENQLEEKLEGFSLFGWVGRLFNRQR